MHFGTGSRGAVNTSHFPPPVFEMMHPIRWPRTLLLAAIGELRPRLVRAKGFAHLAGDARRATLELAGSSLSLAPGAPWGGGESPHSELVFIGEAIDDAELARRLWACRVG